jgi:hypothetical protein
MIMISLFNWFLYCFTFLSSRFIWGV